MLLVVVSERCLAPRMEAERLQVESESPTSLRTHASDSQRGLGGVCLGQAGVGRGALRRARSERAGRVEAGSDRSGVLVSCRVESPSAHVARVHAAHHGKMCSTHSAHNSHARPLHDVHDACGSVIGRLNSMNSGGDGDVVFVGMGEQSHGIRVLGAGSDDPSMVLCLLGTNWHRIIDGGQTRRGRVALAQPGVGQGWWTWGKGAKWL